MITKTFTNQRDAVNFAHAHHGNVYIEIEHIARGQWVVTITYADLMDDEPTGFEISEIESECGVTIEAVGQMAGLADYSYNVNGEARIMFPRNTSAALASATARFLLGAKAKFCYIAKPSGMPVYQKA